MRALARVAITLWLAASLAASGWTLAQNPFAAPLVARGAASARAALDQAIAGTVSLGWLVPRLDAALAADDRDRIALLIGLAKTQGIALPTALRTAGEARLSADAGLLATAAGCALCAYDITACKTLSQIAACAIPVELSPVGDVTALGRAGTAWVSGGEPDRLDAALAAIGLGATIAACAIPVELSPVGDVTALGRAGTAWVSGGEPDRLDAALAAIGLGATLATLASAGASAPVKLGATALRLARRMGALSDRMTGVVLDAARAALGDAHDGRALAAIAADFATISRRTSPAAALSLLRHADSAEDLSRLARLAEIAGPDTARSIEVLGKARALRLIDRLSNLALVAIGLLSLVLSQLGTVLVALLRWALSPLWRGKGRAARRRAIARRDGGYRG